MLSPWAFPSLETITEEVEEPEEPECSRTHSMQDYLSRKDAGWIFLQVREEVSQQDLNQCKPTYDGIGSDINNPATDLSLLGLWHEVRSQESTHPRSKSKRRDSIAELAKPISGLFIGLDAEVDATDDRSDVPSFNSNNYGDYEATITASLSPRQIGTHLSKVPERFPGHTSTSEPSQFLPNDDSSRHESSCTGENQEEHGHIGHDSNKSHYLPPSREHSGVSMPGAKSNKRQSIRESLLKSVPFVQIFDENHKKMIRRDSLKSSTIRVFYHSSNARDDAAEVMTDIGEMMEFLVEDAKKILSNPDSKPEEEELVLDHLQWDGVDPTVRKIDSNASDCYGVEIAERLFWEAYVMTQDCNRPPGSEFDIGLTVSDLQFQEKNLKALRSDGSHEVSVVMQMDSDSPMSPLTLVVAYEKDGRVLPASTEL